MAGCNSGEMIFLEGKVSRGVPSLSKPQLDAVNEMGNLTILLIHTDPDHWAEDRHSSPWVLHGRVAGVSV